MKKIALVSNIKSAELYLISQGVDEFALTERAVNGMLEYFCAENRCLIVCGGANNGGDGYLLAEKLFKKGIFVEVLALVAPKSNTAKTYGNIVFALGVKIYSTLQDVSFCNYNCIVDAVFGSGFKGELSDELKMAFDALNNSSLPIYSIDVPSGLSADFGLGGNIISQKVFTIGAIKMGLLLNKGKDFAKSFEFVDIGLNVEPIAYLLESADCKKYLKNRANFCNKGDFGYVAIMGGCENYVGAVKLALLGESAIRSGCGVSRLIVPNALKPAIMPNVTLSTLCFIDDCNGGFAFNKNQLDEALKKIKTLAFGMGIGLGDGAKASLEYVLRNYAINIIIDADGLTLLSQIGLDILNKTECKVVLSPHLGEFSRLALKNISEIQNNLVSLASEFVQKYNCVLLLKGPSTIICDKNETIVVSQGCSGMATAGSGDVLSGILCGILGYNEVCVGAVATACYINGLSGSLAQKSLCDISMTSMDTSAHISLAIKSICEL